MTEAHIPWSYLGLSCEAQNHIMLFIPSCICTARCILKLTTPTNLHFLPCVPIVTSICLSTCWMYWLQDQRSHFFFHLTIYPFKNRGRQNSGRWGEQLQQETLSVGGNSLNCANGHMWIWMHLHRLQNDQLPACHRPARHKPDQKVLSTTNYKAIMFSKCMFKQNNQVCQLLNKLRCAEAEWSLKR